MRRVEAESGPENGLHVTMEVPVISRDEEEGGAVGPESATLTGDDRLRVEFPVPSLSLPPEVAPAVTVTDRTARVTDDGCVVVTVDLDVEPMEGVPRAERTEGASGTDEGDGGDEDGGSAERGPVSTPSESAEGEEERARERDPLAEVRDKSVPPYEDVPYLRALYDSCETFAEMSDRIGMDVVAETVRRYMIDAGVHDPTSYDTGARGGVEPGPGPEPEPELESGTGTAADDGPAPDPEQGTPEDEAPRSGVTSPSADGLSEERLVADGFGLPEGVDLDDVVDAVAESTTVYEVQRRLGLERDPTRELLRRLDLLDLVLHRLSDGPRQELSREDVVSRVRQVSPAGA